MSPRKPQEETYANLLNLMSAYYNPKPLATVQRYKFYSRFRQSNESISSFVAELRSLAKDCDFGASLEENLRDCLVCGIADSSIQRRLLSEPNLTFKKAFEIAQSHESAAKNIATLHGSSSIPASPTINGEVQKMNLSTDSSCYRCGRTSHQADTCKFKESTCHFCGKVGYIQPSSIIQLIHSCRFISLSFTLASFVSHCRHLIQLFEICHVIRNISCLMLTK